MNSWSDSEAHFVGNLKRKASFQVLLDVSGLGCKFILLHGVYTRPIAWLRK
jgi:hypothetical protein